MRVNNKDRFFSILFGMLLLISCNKANQKPEDISFLNLYPSIEMNQKLKLEVPQNSLGGTGITLVLMNDSNDFIQISPDAEIQIYYYSPEHDWIPVLNTATYYGNVRNLAPSNLGVESVTLVSCNPDLRTLENVRKIRVAVFGVIIDTNSGSIKKTGAYLDVDIK